MKWSVDGQTPEFLAATRMISLSDAIVQTVLEKLHLKPGMRVLDVGSGSGEYSFRLGSALKGVSFTGLEYDAAFVDFANKRAASEVGFPFETPNPVNTYSFVCGDGLDLPFEDGSFDAVVSHTYLTALPDWACALAEMCRVCKPGGTVSSITSLTDDFYGTGTISLFTRLFDAESAELLQLVDKAKAATHKGMHLVNGIPPRKAPVAFDWIGLRNVTCTPLAHYACLSDAATTPDFKNRYVELLYAAEKARIERLKDHPTSRHMLTADQWERYEALVEARRNELLGASANREWNWYGNSSLLVCGTAPEYPDKRWKDMRDANCEAHAALQSLADLGLHADVRMRQLGPGRCVEATLIADGAKPIGAFGFDPPRALLEACSKMAGCAFEKGAVLSALLQDAVEQERLFQRIETQCRNRDHNTLPIISNDIAFQSADIWETVSDAALAGMRVTFKEADCEEGVAIVACEAATPATTAVAYAAHADMQEALRRSLARSISRVTRH